MPRRNSGSSTTARWISCAVRWPGLHFTLCGDDDVPARLSPVLERPGFNVYLVDGSEHCLTLTNDPERAIGVVLAWMDEA